MVLDLKVKMRTDITSISRYDDVIAVFDFSKYVRAAGPDPVVFEPAAALVKAEAGRVRDKIMLGDAAEALALLEVFATMGAA